MALHERQLVQTRAHPSRVQGIRQDVHTRTGMEAWGRFSTQGWVALFV